MDLECDRLTDSQYVYSLHQASFDHVKVGPTPVLALRDLWRNLQRFLDILEFRVKFKKIYIYKKLHKLSLKLLKKL